MFSLINITCIEIKVIGEIIEKLCDNNLNFMGYSIRNVIQSSEKFSDDFVSNNVVC